MKSLVKIKTHPIEQEHCHRFESTRRSVRKTLPGSPGLEVVDGLPTVSKELFCIDNARNLGKEKNKNTTRQYQTEFENFYFLHFLPDFAQISKEFVGYGSEARFEKC